jgi:biopolymer transport protein ExbB/TolQ
MEIVAVLEKMMMVGSTWILYLLIVLSVMVLAITLERYAYFRRTNLAFKEFCAWLNASLQEKDITKIVARCASKQAPAYELVLEALSNAHHGTEALDFHLQMVIAGLRQDMDRRIIFLGTVGSNAPFIGLLGTVFGVIQAFRQLSLTGVGGSNAVMAGISEALVATGVGLLVAIPAVVLFNYFQRTIKIRMANLEALRDLFLSHTKRQNSFVTNIPSNTL